MSNQQPRNPISPNTFGREAHVWNQEMVSRRDDAMPYEQGDPQPRPRRTALSNEDPSTNAQLQPTIIEPYRGSHDGVVITPYQGNTPPVRVEFPSGNAQVAKEAAPPTIHWAEETGINTDVVNWSLFGAAAMLLIIPVLLIGELLTRFSEWAFGQWITVGFIIALTAIGLFMAARSLINTRHSHVRWLSVGLSVLVIFAAAFVLLNFLPHILDVPPQPTSGGMIRGIGGNH